MKNIALVFPGQGSQVVGMAKDFVENFKESRLVFEEASDAINVNLQNLCFEGPLDQLTLTENLQPALFTAEVAMFKAFQIHTDPKPTCFAGHSLGEYSALAAAGSLGIADGAKLTRARGQAMQSAIPVGMGAMAAILGMEDSDVVKLCSDASAETKSVVEPANFNAPGQIVISGSANGVAAACALAKTRSAKAIPLQVSAPFHCSLMKLAQDAMKPLLTSTKFAPSSAPIITNVTASTMSAGFAGFLIEQIVKPVRWSQSMTQLRGMGVERVIEIGPGKVLAGLMKRIDKELACTSVSSVELLKAL